MGAVLAILLIALFCIRVYYYQLSENWGTKGEILFSLLRRYFSFRYAIPQKIGIEDALQTKKYKKIGNKALALFYIVFALAMLYSILEFKGIV
jgi:hypothetical protein